MFFDRGALFQGAFSGLESPDESENDFELMEDVFKKKKAKKKKKGKHGWKYHKKKVNALKSKNSFSKKAYGVRGGKLCCRFVFWHHSGLFYPGPTFVLLV